MQIPASSVLSLAGTAILHTTPTYGTKQQTPARFAAFRIVVTFASSGSSPVNVTICDAAPELPSPVAVRVQKNDGTWAASITVDPANGLAQQIIVTTDALGASEPWQAGAYGTTGAGVAGDSIAVSAGFEGWLRG